MELKDLLNKHYGFSAFRPGQEEIVRSILERNDTLALMPTGAGKSLCYQLPALTFPGITVVISPLIALMKDQVDALAARGLSASFINSSLAPAEIERRTQEALAGKIKLLYIAPERLAAGFTAVLNRLPVDFVAIDEAHCVSAWGHDFRPDYLEIALHINKLPTRPIVAAFTATATPEVKEDIIKRLSLRNPKVFIRGFNRPNLRFFTRAWLSDYQRDKEVLRLVRFFKGSGIIYCGTRNKTEELAIFLQEAGIKALAYHAGIDSLKRTKIQEQFMQDEISVIVATIAFGMGVDKPDVRFVVHAHLPASLENYYQEAGRAGRDGELAHCVLLHSGKDVALHEYFLEKNYEESIERGKSPEEAGKIRMTKGYKLRIMQDYATNKECRRRMILDYFDDEPADSFNNNCRGCDYCLNYQWPEEDLGGETDEELPFGNLDFAATANNDLPKTVLETLALYRRGLGVEEIAKSRTLSRSTVVGHLIRAYLTGEDLDIDQFLASDTQAVIFKAMSECDDATKLSDIKEHCPENISYDDIRWVLAKLQRIRL